MQNDALSSTRVLPTSRQIEFQDWELGLFVHFGIRTFHEGHSDFDGQPMSPAEFNPTGLDCNQWCETAKKAGFKYLVFTAKHHDGFCNWPSAYTDFSVASSPWKNGEGDVVRELAEACARHDIKLGLYYSPADWKSPIYDDPKAYDDYFVNQLSEILTNYGQIHMLWLDGCGSENHDYDWARIDAEVRRLQPEILIFNMGNPDYRWVGNEIGLAPQPLWNVTSELLGSILSTNADILSQPQWLPAECDCRMRDANWFYSDKDSHTVKSLSELMGIYYYSVGRGANLLLNIGPDRNGLLPEPDAGRLLEFGAEIKRRLGHPIAGLEAFKAENNVWVYESETPFFLDHLIVQENLSKGERVRRYSVEILPDHYGTAIPLWEAQSIGHKAICSFPPVRARAVHFRVHESEGAPKIAALEVHLSAETA
ncbi:MAG: alpha-L-fucosidase [Armatimonadetes bacterium]|nr:alpha-L-fucosidase [Armatimonadota bacterium]